MIIFWNQKKNSSPDIQFDIIISLFNAFSYWTRSSKPTKLSNKLHCNQQNCSFLTLLWVENSSSRLKKWIKTFSMPVKTCKKNIECKFTYLSFFILKKFQWLVIFTNNILTKTNCLTDNTFEIHNNFVERTSNDWLTSET